MRSTLAFAALGLGASASAIVPHILPRGGGDECCFTLTAHGPPIDKGPSGILGQLSDGQNRVGGRLPVGIYCLKDGNIIDKSMRGCILTPPTTQFQCDEGAAPTPGFGISCNGQLNFKGSETFWACPVNDDGEWNVYTLPAPGQAKCKQITLTVSGSCTPVCKPPPPVIPQPLPYPVKPNHCGGGDHKCPSKPSECEGEHGCHSRPGKCEGGHECHSRPGKCEGEHECHSRPGKCEGEHKCQPKPSKCKGEHDCQPKPVCHDKSKCGDCPANLKGPYEFPHLIIPVDSNHPDMYSGTRLNGTVSGTICSAFNFDVRREHAGKTCSLIFLFPEQYQLETSAFELKGHGKLRFFKLEKPVTTQTTWNSLPGRTFIHSVPAVPGTQSVIMTFACPAAEKVSFLMCGKGIYFDYFQDFNPAPIGLYIRQC
ncbi:uncharacterized protein BDR25DRAFT_213209 [Lindgomyces ingoldianus]|uniref:Uncharacterized protein n=1 Tax=Lindgomyces ingoldianus TaxID=673940 RepID=A0ACB6R8K5_9PLEO|nr:uncharacterized protein BDR25DRAFT_213209 [Lindgomyces ingoldianus]KAF2475584.1 hypothetical protein BDR25DRAFT_213209 [Lindgomyces ingoldianus]